MRTLRFGRKLKLPPTIVIKHQLRTLMYRDAVAKAERELKPFADNRAETRPPAQSGRGVEVA
jgi:hypothetical protein